MDICIHDHTYTYTDVDTYTFYQATLSVKHRKGARMLMDVIQEPGILMPPNLLLIPQAWIQNAVCEKGLLADIQTSHGPYMSYTANYCISNNDEEYLL